MAAAIWPLRDRTPALTVPLGAAVYGVGAVGARRDRPAHAGGAARMTLGARRLRPSRSGRAWPGPAIRAYELARALAGHVRRDARRRPRRARSPTRGCALLEAGMADVEALVAAAREHDVVIAQELPPVVLERLARRPARLVADLYNPIVVEVLAGVAGRPPRRAAADPRADRRAHARAAAPRPTW